MSNFGIPYMGSKSKIAPEIIAFLPKGRRLVDLFGGGMAITECGMYSKKWDKYLYNELNPLVVELVKKAINGDYNYNKFKPTFITPEEFKKKYNQDGYIKYIWSFSNQGEDYIFGKNVYKAKEQGHNYCIFDKPIDGLNIPIIKGTPYQKRMFLKKWCQATFEKEWKRATPRIKSDYKKYPFDGKYVLSYDKFICCQSNAKNEDLKTLLNDGKCEIIINPLGEWTGGINVDSGATNRKLGSDMGHSVTGGGLHGKDLSKADVSVNIYAFLKAQETGQIVELCCAIGDDTIDGRPYSEIVEIARNYINKIGGFEKFAEWGLF